MTALTRSKDTKVANIVKARPSGVVPLIANSFGLPSGVQFSCPDATAFCSTTRTSWSHNNNLKGKTS